MGGVYPVVIFFYQLRAGRVYILGGQAVAEESLHGPNVPGGDVHLFPLPLGQGSLVLYHHHGLQLGLIARLAEGLAAGGPLALFRVQVGVFKEAAAEDVFQQPHRRFLHAPAHGLLAVALAT